MISAILLSRRAFQGLVERVRQAEAARNAELEEKLAKMSVAKRLLLESLGTKPAKNVIQDMLILKFYRIFKATDEHDSAYDLDDELLGYLNDEEGAAYHNFATTLRAKAHEDDLED